MMNIKTPHRGTLQHMNTDSSFTSRLETEPFAELSVRWSVSGNGGTLILESVL